MVMKLFHNRKGFTLVELMIVLAIIGIIAAFAIPNLMKSRVSANEMGAVGALRTIMSAEGTYMNREGKYGTIKQLYDDGLIDKGFIDGRKSGYYYGELFEAGSETAGTEYRYAFGAVPCEEDRSGTKEYIIDQAGTIYESQADVNHNLATEDTDWSSKLSSAWTSVGLPSNATWAPIQKN